MGRLRAAVADFSLMAWLTLTAWLDATVPGRVLDRLRRFFIVYFPFTTLTKEQLDLIHETVHRAVVIAPWHPGPRLS
jgi:hypothetical protein